MRIPGMAAVLCCLALTGCGAEAVAPMSTGPITPAERALCDRILETVAAYESADGEYNALVGYRIPEFAQRFAVLFDASAAVEQSESSLRGDLRRLRSAVGDVRRDWVSEQIDGAVDESLDALEERCDRLEPARYAPEERPDGEIDVYRGVRCRSGPVEVRVDASRHRIVSDHGREVVSLRQTAYGDVTGDGFPERVVVFGCRERRDNPQEEKLASWRLPGKLSVFVIRTDGPKPVRLGQVLYGREAWVRDTLLQVRALPGNGDVMTYYRLTRDRWEPTIDRPS